MKEIYRKTSFVGFISGVGISLFCLYYYFYVYEDFSKNGIALVEFGLAALAALGTGFYFRNAYEKLTDINIKEIPWNIENVKELNFQRVPSLLPKLYNVDSEGNPLFKIEPSKGGLSRGLTFLGPFEKGLILPVTYDISTIDGERIATFKIKNNVKQYVLSLMKPDGTLMCYYIEKLTKSAFKNRGILYHADGTVWRELEAKGAAGDIDVKDEEGKITASYRYGIFPYAMNPAFQSTAHHEHVRFGAHISTEEKLAYTMIFHFWLKG